MCMSSAAAAAVFLDCCWCLLLLLSFSAPALGRGVKLLSEINDEDENDHEPTTKVKSKATIKYAVAISASIVAAVIVLALIWWFLQRQAYKRSTMSHQSLEVGKSNMEHMPLPDSVKNAELGSSLPRQLSLVQIKAATDDFKTLLGQGSFGKVYLGNLEGKKIAVKKIIRKELNVSAEEYNKEMEILMKIKHKNLVKLVAHCNDNVHCFLCFEYLSGGSLDKRLYVSNRNKSVTAREAGNRAPLDWRSRYYIIREVCTGLHYLHVELDSEEKILHMDLKAGNILIDRKPGGGLIVKIADFGISRLFKADQTHEYIKVIVGVKPYMAPEYFQKGKLSVKVDIYSFGMLILEMVTGSCADNIHEFPGRNDFMNKVRHAWEKGDIREVLDHDLRAEECDIPQVRDCIEVAFDCLQEDPEKRPGTAEIAQRLVRREDNAAANSYLGSIYPV